MAGTTQPRSERGRRSARALLARLDAEGRVRATGAPVKQLERALLAPSIEVHTERGSHALELVSWSLWAAERGVTADRSPDAGRSRLEAAARALAAGSGTDVPLPWRTTGAGRSG